MQNEKNGKLGLAVTFTAIGFLMFGAAPLVKAAGGTLPDFQTSCRAGETPSPYDDYCYSYESYYYYDAAQNLDERNATN